MNSHIAVLPKVTNTVAVLGGWPGRTPGAEAPPPGTCTSRWLAVPAVPPPPRLPPVALPPALGADASRAAASTAAVEGREVACRRLPPGRERMESLAPLPPPADSAAPEAPLKSVSSPHAVWLQAGGRGMVT